MKKVVFIFVAILGFTLANAQDGQFKGGLTVGLPMGDVKDSYSLNVGLDIAYTWAITDKFNAGVGLGFTNFSGKKEEFNLGVGTGTVEVKNLDAAFVPVYGTAQYSFTENIFAGADLGYALGTAPEGNDGGFLFQPKVGYQTTKFEVYTGYKGISVDGSTFSSLNLGFNYKF